MTRMSESYGQPTLGNGAKGARLLALCRVARVVHDRGVLVVISMLLLAGGCIIPPSLSVENQDAGVNSPPSITAVRAEAEAYFEPGPIPLVKGEGSLNFSLLDIDTIDTLYVRVFVDYSVEDPDPARASCMAPSSESTRRSVTCDIGAVCNDEAIAQSATKDLLMSVVVFDRQPLESGEPMFQAMPEGGLSTSRSFKLQCSAP
jgi:hypothetical protein